MSHIDDEIRSRVEDLEGGTPDSPVDQARKSVEQALKKAETDGLPSAAFDVADDLGRLPEGERADAIARFKKVLGSKLSVTELKKLVRAKARTRKTRVRPSGLRPIHVNGRQLRDLMEDVVRELAAHNEPPEVYLRCGGPARIRVDERGTHTIETLNESGLRNRLTQVADFYHVDDEGEGTATAPPLDGVRGILSLDLNAFADEHGLAPFPALDVITETPTLRPDGSILSAPGYDAATRMFHAPAVDLNVPRIPEYPTESEVQAAVKLVDEAIGEFPYEGQTDRSNAFGLMLTPFTRPAITGNVPMVLVDATQKGSGKTLLAHVVAMAATGREPPLMGSPDSEEEWRKQITAALLEGQSLIVFDNITGTLSSASLARAVSCSVWGDRILGQSVTAKTPQRAVWIGTANNPTLGGDMARRCYRIRLDAKTDKPWVGRTFTHPNLIEWVTANRGRLVGALLTISRAWYAAGQPAGTGPVIGGFESWSRTIGGILEFVGLDGFLGNLDQVYDQADDETAQWHLFLKAWSTRYGEQPITTAIILAAIQTEDGKALREALPDSLVGMVEAEPARGFGVGERHHVRDAGKFKIRLGRQLKDRVGRRYGDEQLHIVRSEDTHTKVCSWAVHSAGSAGSEEAAAGSQKEHYPPSNHSSPSELHEHAGSAGSCSKETYVRENSRYTKCVFIESGEKQPPALPALPANDLCSSLDDEGCSDQLVEDVA